MQLTERTDGDNGIHYQQRRSILGYVEVVLKSFKRPFALNQIGQNNSSSHWTENWLCVPVCLTCLRSFSSGHLFYYNRKMQPYVKRRFSLSSTTDHVHIGASFPKQKRKKKASLSITCRATLFQASWEHMLYKKKRNEKNRNYMILHDPETSCLVLLSGVPRP